MALLKKLFFCWGVALFCFTSCCEAMGDSNFISRSSHFVFDPTDNNRLYYLARGIFYRSENLGFTWRASKITSGVERGTGSISVSPYDEGDILVVLMDEGEPKMFFSDDYGDDWREFSTVGLPSFSPKMDVFVSLMAAPERSHNWFLFLHDFSQIQPQTFLYQWRGREPWQKVEFNLPTVNCFVWGADAFEETIFLNPLYAMCNEDGEQKYIQIYRSYDYGETFSKVQAEGLPDGWQVSWFAVPPKFPNTIYALTTGDTGQGPGMRIYYSHSNGNEWEQLDLSGLGKEKPYLFQTFKESFNLRFIYTINKEVWSWQGTESKYLKMDLSETGFKTLPYLLANPRQEKVLLSSDYSGQHLFRSMDSGNNWEEISPRFEAKWILQSTGEGFIDLENGAGLFPLIAEPGDKLDLEAHFLNSGNVCWNREGNLKVGFYVYKDEVYSWPPEYNDSQNPLFGTSAFAGRTWGPSANGLKEQARAALLSEREVEPGEEGSFNFDFYIPRDIPVSPLEDEEETERDERYYREDLTLAWGENWMHNYSNGDPLDLVHVWFPVIVED